jgi:hypothetical protein
MILGHAFPGATFGAYLSLWIGVLYLCGEWMNFNQSDPNLHWLSIFAICFQLLLGIVFSFNSIWQFNSSLFYEPKAFVSSPIISALILIIGVLLIFVPVLSKKVKLPILIIRCLMIFSPVLFLILSLKAINAGAVVTIVLFFVGIYAIITAGKTGNAMIANLALSLVAIVIFCRFADTKMSLVLKGLLFIAIGIGFFLANYVIVKNQKK